MATAAGIECDVDPLLFNTMKAHCGKIERVGCRQYSLSLSLSLSLFVSLCLSLSLSLFVSLSLSLSLSLSFYCR